MKKLIALILAITLFCFFSPFSRDANHEILAIIFCSMICIYTVLRVLLCAGEHWIMTRKGYWYDSGFQGRNKYYPEWRHETKPSIPTKFTIE